MPVIWMLPQFIVSVLGSFGKHYAGVKIFPMKELV